ncbi:MAG: cytochrome oxidase assembly protein [Schlesneria sp.]|nr:cytochrome oxidase assembly protein [Schlesneria sp.]
MNVSSSSRWLHRFAWLTATLTLLLPVTTGALVTTLKAGMAFADWPSSDGYNMLAYPWLSSARDQFIEHGHRLSGLTIGVLSIALAIAAWCIETRGPARWLASAIFLSVFVQGMLGGARVLMDKQTMALIHGDFAAGVFSLMGVFVLMTGAGWESREIIRDVARAKSVRNLAVAVLVTVAIQYFLGGVLRHLGESWAWMLHPWFAIVPVVLSVLFAAKARQTGSAILNRGAKFLLALIVSQALLGLASWYVRFGVPSWGVVAELNSPAQIIVCSLHKVVGMLTLMTTVLNTVCAVAVQPRYADRAVGSTKFEGSMMGAAT